MEWEWNKDENGNQKPAPKFEHLVPSNITIFNYEDNSVDINGKHYTAEEFEALTKAMIEHLNVARGCCFGQNRPEQNIKVEPGRIVELPPDRQDEPRPEGLKGETK